MTKRSELAVIIAYLVFLLCAGFVQFAHEIWDAPALAYSPQVGKTSHRN